MNLDKNINEKKMQSSLKVRVRAHSNNPETGSRQPGRRIPGAMQQAEAKVCCLDCKAMPEVRQPPNSLLSMDGKLVKSTREVAAMMSTLTAPQSLSGTWE